MGKGWVEKKCSVAVDATLDPLIILCCSLIACGGSGEGSVFVEPEAPPHVPIERFGVVWEGLEVDSGTVQPGNSFPHPRPEAVSAEQSQPRQ